MVVKLTCPCHSDNSNTKQKYINIVIFVFDYFVCLDFDTRLWLLCLFRLRYIHYKVTILSLQDTYLTILITIVLSIPKSNTIILGFFGPFDAMLATILQKLKQNERNTMKQKKNVRPRSPPWKSYGLIAHGWLGMTSMIRLTCFKYVVLVCTCK